ncbi:hypothetical protein KBB96_14465 [Luteolibacter ambystomatis]|uniref:Uncharacterized protein n=1 Tax=Luteolibacter ambystomatis TaxID=2824561 RepID=A0A975G668_9BACT|nr:hypothetical protein [Luteolibacter ambystomatis]QUE50067.1 hypothetical protein KBB96_14465 [Luteolibacter ambystomatis]
MFRFLFPSLLATACAGAVTVWQPVVDPAITVPGTRPDGALFFSSYGQPSNFGGEIGFTPARPARITAKDGALVIAKGSSAEGLWASLAGPAGESDRTFDAGDLLGIGGLPASRVPVTAVAVDVKGKGKLRVQIGDVKRVPLWSGELTVDSTESTRLRLPFDAKLAAKAKFLSFTVPPETEITLRRMGFEAEKPDIEPADWLFRISLGKLRRCLDPQSGLTAARAHTGKGRFLALPGSGMNALATAIAAKQGLIDPKQAADEVRVTARTLLAINQSHGFLPHFANREPDGRVERSEKTEYSSVDTALTLQGLLLAADVLELNDTAEAVRQRIRSIDWSGMIDEKGFPHHGYSSSTGQVLSGAYRGWGGEQALTVLLEGMARGDKAQGKLATNGKIYRGVGFIAEIQSLFHPDFDRPEADRLSGISWPETRRRLANDQAGYFTKRKPECPASKLGLWGLSAGEGGMPGAAYAANGCDLPDLTWIHPHYPVMACMSDPARLEQVIGAFEKAGLLFPRGLPETVSIDGVRYNPMQCSLNASFETLAAYHAWKRPSGQDVVDQASLADPLIRMGMRRFYTQAP